MAMIASVDTRSMLSQKRWLVSCRVSMSTSRRSVVLPNHSAMLALLHGATQRLMAATSR